MWSDLNMQDRSRWMKFFMENGVYDLSLMKQEYNNYQVGGWIAKQYYNAKIQPKIDELGIDEVRKRLYDNIYPQGYENGMSRVSRALDNKW